MTSALGFVSFARPYRPMSASLRSPSFLGNPCLRALLYDPGRANSLRCEPVLPSTFRDGVGLCTFFTGLNHTARTLTTYASPFGSPLGRKARFQLCLPALAGRGSVPAGFQLEVSAHGILLNQTLAGAPRRRGGFAAALWNDRTFLGRAKVLRG